jgi:hypothetical protein
MEQSNDREASVTQSPFNAAASFGTALSLEQLPGWSLQFIHSGEHTYAVRSDGVRTVWGAGGDA